MKILFIHTYYSKRGGEDTVFEMEKELISERALVKSIVFRNKTGILGLIQFILSIWNLHAIAKVRAALKDFKPDLVHVHNIHFAAGPAILRIFKKYRVPVVLTIHNYRIVCPSATLLNGDQIFLHSLKTEFPWSAVFKKVYRNSLTQTFWLAVVNWFHTRLGTWNSVSRLVFLTRFSKEIFELSKIGLDNSKFRIQPNFVKERVGKSQKRDSHYLFVGRLSHEKGILLLLNAFSNINTKLKIVGDGPLRKMVINYASNHANIEYIGELDTQGVSMEMKVCRSLIFPSIWFEGMPLTILEAFASGTPVIASNFGTMGEIIADGVNGRLFQVNDTRDLAEKVHEMNLLDANSYQSLCENCYDDFQIKYSRATKMTSAFQLYGDILS